MSKINHEEISDLLNRLHDWRVTLRVTRRGDAELLQLIQDAIRVITALYGGEK